MTKEREPKDEIILENILTLMERRGWKMAELCRRVGIDQSNFNSLKSGLRGFGNKNIKRFAKVLDTTVEYLLTKHNEPPLLPIKEPPDPSYTQKQIENYIENEKFFREKINKLEAKIENLEKKFVPRGSWDGTDERSGTDRRKTGGKKN